MVPRPDAHSTEDAHAAHANTLATTNGGQDLGKRTGIAGPSSQAQLQPSEESGRGLTAAERRWLASVTGSTLAATSQRGGAADFGPAATATGGSAYHPSTYVVEYPASDTGKEGVGAFQSTSGGNRQQRVAKLQAQLLPSTTSTNTLAPTQRNSSVRKTLEELGRLYPEVSPVLQQVRRYVKELGAAQDEAQAAYRRDLQEKEREVYAKLESFFEEKICGILRDKAKWERAANELHAEVRQLRQERDTDLMDAKADLMRFMNRRERHEEELKEYRQLIKSVYQTNEMLTDRVQDLERLLTQHRIDVPPSADELFAYNGKRNAAEEARQEEKQTGVKPLKEQVSISFIAASQQEMAMSRLTLQRELLHCAFDDRSAYRLQLNGLQTENNDLKFKVAQLEEKITELYRYIHVLRFQPEAGVGGVGGEVGTQSAVGLLTAKGEPEVPMTPRPRDVPFAIQLELGVDLCSSTADIVAELSAVATNLKHQLNSALLRLRQMTTVSEWLLEDTLLELEVEREQMGVLPTFPTSAWPTLPHFLRTRVSPDVNNIGWSAVDAAALLLEFFTQYDTLREQARYVRDAKMITPPKTQLFERRERLLVRLDATKAEMAKDGDTVPFGYVVSHFIYTFLMNLAPGTQSGTLVLPGTLYPHFTVRGEERVVELEFTRLAYNLWWAVQRYKDTQPLCQLFLAVIAGRVPVAIFGQMQRVLSNVAEAVARMDTEGSNTFTYTKLVGGVLRLVSDLDAESSRCGVLAVAQTFETNEAPIIGGRLHSRSLLSDESYRVEDAPLDSLQGNGTGTSSGGATGGTSGSGGTGGNGKNGSGSVTNKTSLPPTITARAIPYRSKQPLGASVFVRYWRKLVLTRYEAIYRLVERCLAPVVMESEVVVGLYVFSASQGLRRLRLLDRDPEAKAEAFVLGAFPAFPTGESVGDAEASFDDGVSPTSPSNQAPHGVGSTDLQGTTAPPGKGKKNTNGVAPEKDAEVGAGGKKKVRILSDEPTNGAGKGKKGTLDAGTAKSATTEAENGGRAKGSEDEEDEDEENGDGEEDLSTGPNPLDLPEVTRNYHNLLRERKAVLMAQRTTQRVMLESIVRPLLQNLPRLNRSVHFPFHFHDGGKGPTAVTKVTGTLPVPPSQLTKEVPTLLSPVAAERAETDSAQTSPAVDTTTAASVAAANPSPSPAPSSTGSGAGHAISANGTSAAAAAGKKRAKRKPANGTATGTSAAAAGAPAGGEGRSGTQGKAGKRGTVAKRRKRLESTATNIAEAMARRSDAELVEWYGFCFALRQALLPLTEQIFHGKPILAEPAPETTPPAQQSDPPRVPSRKASDAPPSSSPQGGTGTQPSGEPAATVPDEPTQERVDAA